MIRPILGETLEGCLVTSVLLLTERLVVPELQALEIGIDQGVLVFVLLMKPQQILEQSDRLYLWRLVIVRIDFPSQKILGGCKNRTVGGQDEGILSF